VQALARGVPTEEGRPQAREIVHVIEAAMSTLEPDQRETVLLLYVEGLVVVVIALRRREPF